jgi:hypothetical protein
MNPVYLSYRQGPVHYIYTEPRRDDDRRVITFETEPVKPPNRHAGPQKNKEKEKWVQSFWGKATIELATFCGCPGRRLTESISLY